MVDDTASWRRFQTLTVVKYEGIVDYNTGQVVKNTGEMHDMDSAILKLKQHLDAEPGDINGWMMYGRTLLTLRKYPQAADAFEHAPI